MRLAADGDQREPQGVHGPQPRHRGTPDRGLPHTGSVIGPEWAHKGRRSPCMPFWVGTSSLMMTYLLILHSDKATYEVVVPQ